MELQKGTQMYGNVFVCRYLLVFARIENKREGGGVWMGGGVGSFEGALLVI